MSVVHAAGSKGSTGAAGPAEAEIVCPPAGGAAHAAPAALTGDSAGYHTPPPVPSGCSLILLTIDQQHIVVTYREPPFGAGP